MILARFLMDEKGITKKQMANLTGTDLPTLEQLLFGVISPNDEQLIAFAKALDFERDINELFQDFKCQRLQ